MAPYGELPSSHVIEQATSPDSFLEGDDDRKMRIKAQCARLVAIANLRHLRRHKSSKLHRRPCSQFSTTPYPFPKSIVSSHHAPSLQSVDAFIAHPEYV